MQGGSLLSVYAVVVGERSLCLLRLILCEVGGHRYLRDGKCSVCFEVACDAQPFLFTPFGSAFGSTFGSTFFTSFGSSFGSSLSDGSYRQLYQSLKFFRLSS